MLRAIIIDDEQSALISLELLINKFIPQVRIISKTTNPAEGIELINDFRPDIVFLDIQMPRLTGFDVLELLEYNDFYFVFTTAYHEHGLKALKKNATDYLLKPVNYEELKSTVARIQNKIREKQSMPDVTQILQNFTNYWQFKIPVPAKNSIEYILPEDIVYIEAKGRNSLIKLKDKEVIMSTGSLKYYNEILCKPGLPFMRIHFSFVVNLNYVTRYCKENGGCIVLINQVSIPVSKKTKSAFLKYIHIDSHMH